MDENELSNPQQMQERPFDELSRFVSDPALIERVVAISDAFQDATRETGLPCGIVIFGSALTGRDIMSSTASGKTPDIDYFFDLPRMDTYKKKQELNLALAHWSSELLKRVNDKNVYSAPLMDINLQNLIDWGVVKSGDPFRYGYMILVQAQKKVLLVKC